MSITEAGRLCFPRPEVWTHRPTAMRRSTVEGAYSFIEFTPQLNFGAGGLARSIAEVDRSYTDDKVIWQEQVYDLARLVCERQAAERVIDFGAGAGQKFIKAFGGFAIERFQVDWDDRREAVEPAGSRAASTFLTANLEDFGDLERIAGHFTDNAATVFLLSDVVEHLQDPRPLLRTIRRLLRQNKNSRFIISTPDRDRVDGFGSVRLPDNTGHVRQWTLNEFGLAMLSAGFDIVDIGHVAQNNFDELDRTIAAELRCSEAGYERFLETNRLPARADHLVVTTEHADAMSTGGIGTYYRNCEIAGFGPRIFLFAGAHGLPAAWLDFVRSKGWVHVAQMFERGNKSREDILPVLNDDILYAVQHLVFLYDDLRLVEYQDYLGIGARIAQAKRAALLPPSLCVCAYAHGTHVYLDNARGELGKVARSSDIDVRERLSLELADVVLFPSRFIQNLYLDRQGLRVRRALHQAYPIRLLRKPISALARQPIDTLIFYGKQTPQKGYPEFCDAVVRLFDDPAYGSIARQIRRILLLGVSDPDKRLVELPDIEVVTGTYPLSEVVTILVDNGPRALAVLPYKADNHPLSVFEVVDAGCQILAFDVGGVPELLPSELSKHLLCAPDAKALAAGISKAVGLSFYDRTKLLDETWHRVNDRYTAISRDFRETFASLKQSLPRDRAERGAVSLIVPNLNGEHRFFDDLAFGVRNSFLRPSKVFFVDDGSDAEGRDRLTRGMTKLGDISHDLTCHPGNRGLAAARNTGLAQVETPYVCAHDNDNILLNHYLSVACSILDDNPDVDAVTAWSWSFRDGTPWDAQRRKWDYDYRPIGQDLGAILRSNAIGDALAVYRTKAIRDMGGWDQSSKAAWEDWQLFARMTAAGKKVWVIPEAMFLYRVRGDSMLQTYSRFAGELRLAKVFPGIQPADGFSLISTLRQARRLVDDFSEQLIERRQSEMRAVARSARGQLEVERQATTRLSALRSDATTAILQSRNEAIAAMIGTARQQVLVERRAILRRFLVVAFLFCRRTARLLGQLIVSGGKTRMQDHADSVDYRDDRRLVELTGLFDPEWYRRVYPDLSSYQGDLLDHYMQYGGREGRSPGPLFDGGFYLATYPDIKQGAINPLVHFIRYGVDEGRWPAPLPSLGTTDRF